MIDSLPGLPEMPEISVRMTARSRKGIFAFLLISICVLFALMYLVTGPELFGNYQYSRIDNYTKANVTIIPLPNSEIWLDDDEKLWTYGSFLVISNNTNVEWLDIHGNQIPLIENDSIIVDSSTLGSQSGITYLIMSNGTTIEWKNLGISTSSLANTRLLNIVVKPALILLTSLMIIGNLGWVVLSVDIDKSYELIGNQSISFIPSQEREIEYYIERTDLIREALNSKLKDANESANHLASLYFAIATGLIGVTYFIISIPIQLEYKALSALACIMGIAFCGKSVFDLFGLRTSRRKSDRTPWDSRWNIYPNSKGVDRFKADTTRIFRAFSSWSKKEIFAENVREIRYLYECNSDTERKISRRRRSIWLPLYLVGMGTTMVLMDVMDPLYIITAMVIFGAGVSILTLFKGAWSNLGELNIQRRFVIYYSISHTNQNPPQIQDFEMNWEYLAPLGVLLEDTSNYTQADLNALREAARSIYMQSERNPDSTELFGPTPGSFDFCGREVPVLIISTRGEIDSNEIFPQENDNLVTTIVDAIKTMVDNDN